MTAPIVPIILSGGSGTRLWPRSTGDKPKQFQALGSDRTLFAETLARAEGARFRAPIIVGATRHAALIEAELGKRDAHVILEPAQRNTAAAIALAALAAGASDAAMLVMPSDHVITDPEAFAAAIDTALPAAHNGWLVTFGIAPTGPETGYGYIAAGDPVPKVDGVSRVARFIEKPPREAAEAMLAAGGHMWNAGIFLMRADAYLEELAIHEPQIRRAAVKAHDLAEQRGRLVHPHAPSFEAAHSLPVDVAVMEKSERVAVVPVDCGWSDIGSWDAMHSLRADPDDPAGNAFSGDVIAEDCEGCLIEAGGITIAAAGLKDIIVVADGDRVLIVPRGQSQKVKALAEAFEHRKREDTP